MKEKTKDKSIVTSIEGGIQKNNKLTIRVLIVLAVFTAICLLLIGAFALMVKGNAASAIDIERANSIQSEWTSEVIRALSEGILRGRVGRFQM